MKTLQILMPMVGLGKRFSEKGFKIPKPLISVNGMPMFKKAISSFHAFSNIINIYVVFRREHDEQFGLGAELLKNLPDAKCIVTEKMTRGAAESCLLAESSLSCDDPLIILDCDLWFTSVGFEAFIYHAINDSNFSFDGGISFFESKLPKYSFVKIEDDIVVDFAEKEVISNKAVIGAYFFTRAGSFLEEAKIVTKQPIDERLKEFYISKVIRSMISKGAKFKAFKSEEYYSFGTPEELEDYNSIGVYSGK